MALLTGCGGGAIQGWTGERRYAAGDFAAASAAFEKALAADSSARHAFSAGNALYRMRRYEDAAKRYRLAASGQGEMRQRGWFNLGNALVRAAENAPERPELLDDADRVRTRRRCGSTPPTPTRNGISSSLFAVSATTAGRAARRAERARPTSGGAT